MIEERAYAKLNLSLEITGKRPDGYHDIVTVMQLIDLHDTLTFDPADSLSLWCNDPSLAAEGMVNLVWTAAYLLQETTGVRAGADIRLTKAIPMAGGLAGGSSDAAATLRGLARLWGLDLSWGEMHYLASRIGSDVPFFLEGPTALVEGRGEIVTTISSLAPSWAVLVSQPYDVPDKTRRLYMSLRPDDTSDGAATRALMGAIGRGKFPSSSMLGNAFERAAYTVFDGLADVRDTMQSLSGRDVHLSGSGPTLFVLYPEARESAARKLHVALRQVGLRTYLTRTLTEK